MKSTLTDKQLKAYLASDSICPCCKREGAMATTLTSLTASGGEDIGTCVCDNCGSQWVETRSLTKLVILEDKSRSIKS